MKLTYVSYRLILADVLPRSMCALCFGLVPESCWFEGEVIFVTCVASLGQVHIVSTSTLGSCDVKLSHISHFTSEYS